MKAKARCCALLFCLLSLALGGQAQAHRTLLTSEAAKAIPGGIEGACGIAVSSGLLYVSDYYHRAIDVFSASTGIYQSQLPFGSSGGPCQLASSPGGALYASEWHEGVRRVLPSALTFDEKESTGVAVDQVSGKVYVNDRTYVAVYEPSGAPALDGEGDELKIGLDKVSGESSLGDAYGLAFFGGRLYVPDASDSTVKVYEPAVDTVNPVMVIDGGATPQNGFNSLVDAAVAVDPTNAHLLVLDNLQPGFEHPQAVLDEFSAEGTFLGQVSQKLIDGEPSGLAFDGANLYATSGNSEGSAVFKFGPYVPGGPLSAGEASVPPSPSQPLATAVLSSKGGPSTAKRDFLSQAVVIQRRDVRVSFDGRLAPKKLPRHSSAPVRVSVAAKISPTDEAKDPPQLKTISIAINRYGHFDPKGLPLCTERDIQPATNRNALKACRSSLVGVGSFEAKVRLSQQSPFPAEGKMYAFNARIHGRPAILAHVYGTNPVPTSFTFPFELRSQKGTYGTVLRADLPQASGDSGFITGLSMNLGRSFSFHGARHSYLTASCPAPKGFHEAVFPLAHARFAFKGGRSVGSTLVRSCGVRG